MNDAQAARLRELATQSLSTVKGRFDLAMEGEAILALLDERDALRRERNDLCAMGKMVCELADKARSERDAALALLRRIRAWDMLDTAGDGPYWKREIDAMLGDGGEA